MSTVAPLPGDAPRGPVAVDSRGRAQVAALAIVIAGTLLLPAGLRLVTRLAPASGETPSYLPALEPTRVRSMAFDADVVANLKILQAEFVLIGDSMVGSRVDPTYLANLLGQRGVAPIYYAATGSAFWYLALKNWVVASQTRPKLVIFFFRDENLTDPLFRASGSYRGELDRVARDREPVLDDILAMRTQGPFFRFHTFLDGVYDNGRARHVLEPLVANAPVAIVARGRARRTLLERINKEAFGLEALRPMPAADIAQADEAAYDFQRNLPRSVLPEMLRVGRNAGIRLAFVRVQRRPAGNAPPAQSPALRQYMRDLRAYLEQNGALFADDWGDPEEPLSIYADGDHLDPRFRRQYTEQFVRKHPSFFR